MGINVFWRIKIIRCRLRIGNKNRADNPGLWGGWQFQVTQRDELANGTIGLQFGYGGYQEARGSGVSNQHLYVENVLEELDSPGEWCVQTALHVCFFSHACFFVCLLI